MSPYLLAPLAGIIADRLERRLLVRVTRVGAFGVTTVLFLLAVTGVIEVWMVVGMALVQGIVRASGDTVGPGAARERGPRRETLATPSPSRA